MFLKHFICNVNYLSWPDPSEATFCLNQCIELRQGETRCPVCEAAFEIDDRAECVFGDPNEIRLPVIGIICASCGLIQAGESQNCLYCWIAINTAVH